jgi:uncharacterized repeat protein (TIGR03803 family)
MRGEECLVPQLAMLIVLIMLPVTLLTPAAAQQEAVLLNLTNYGGVGSHPITGLTADAEGNLYGTTTAGGPPVGGGGTVFELIPSNGSWTKKVLHPFLNSVHDGQSPQAGVTLDKAGNIYGTTYWGGLFGDGTVFELTPQPNGSWTEKHLHTFGGATADGKNPLSSVIFDFAGNLYGTTFDGGTHGVGNVYELIPQGDGTWKEKILHQFGSFGRDGTVPLAGLVLDGAGNLYGAANLGGLHGTGVIFELSPSSGGTWTYKIIHNFNRSGDGEFPYGTPILDAAGNLYGTTTQGGHYGWGTVYELSPTPNGQWAETLLHSFNNDTTEGFYPYSALIFDAAGNLYGTTEAGGPYYGGTVIGGTAFKLTPEVGGVWTETVLHFFGASGDGDAVLGDLIFDAAGNLYGTTDDGGTTGYGTVFEIVP